MLKTWVSRTCESFAQSLKRPNPLRRMVWAWMLWSSYALGTGTELWSGHGCSGHCMLEHERNCGLGMDALVIVCSAGGHMAATGFPCAPTLEPHQLQRNLVGTTERRVHEAALGRQAPSCSWEIPNAAFKPSTNACPKLCRESQQCPQPCSFKPRSINSEACAPYQALSRSALCMLSPPSVLGFKS